MKHSISFLFISAFCLLSLQSIAQIGTPNCQATVDVDPMCMERIGDYAYVGHWNGGKNSRISIYDVSTPGTAVYIGNEDHGTTNGLGDGSVLDMESDGSYLYAASRYREEFYVLDYSNPVDLNVVATVPINVTPAPESIPVAMRIVGNNAFIIDNYGYLYTIDITNPITPSLTNTFATGGNPSDLDISGNVAYIANSNGLLLLDITNPNAPSVITTITDAANYYKVFVNGTHLYATSGSDLYTYDISTLNSPVLQLGSPLALTNTIRSFAVDGTDLYVGTRANGTVGAVTLLDISTPASPSILEESDAASHRSMDIFLHNGFVYTNDELYNDEICIYGTPCSTTTSTDVQSACDSYTWIDGNTYTADNNTATHTLTNAGGCDSIVTLNLTIISLDDQTVTASPTEICDNGSSTITIGNSQSGVDYYLRDDSDNSIVDGPIVGTGSSLNLNTGTINSTTTYNVLAENVIEDTASTFDGSTNLNNNSNTGFINWTQISVEAWINPTVNNVEQTIAARQSNIGVEWMFRVESSGELYAIVQAQSTGYLQVFSSTIIPQNTWSHVAFSFDGVDLKVFIDGVDVSGTTIGTPGANNPLWGSSIIPTTIGSRGNNTRYFNGQIEDVRIWKERARTESEILNNQCTIDPSTTDLYVNYLFNEDLLDATANGLNLTLGTGTETYNNYVPGCDGLTCDLEMSQTVTVTVNNSNTGTDVQTACDSYTWIDGNTYTADNNTATFTLTNAAGCDSVVTLDLTINNSTTGTDVQTACDSYTWIDGNTYTADNNTATFTLTNAAGCDSVVTLDLTINNSTTGTDVQTACDSYTWIDGNTYTADNNTATFTLTNAAGCDSVVTLDLTINNSTTGTDMQTACDSYTWIDGNTYTADNNTATFTLTNAAGCDSVVTLDLTINNSTTGTDVQTACDSYTWIDGNTYTADNNTATFTLTNAAGCDSVVTLDLTINNSTTGTDVQTACDSYTWIDGNTYTSDNNTATFTLTNAAGCDSVVTLDLTINNSTTGTDVQTACDSYTWIDGNTYTADNNTATFTLTNAAGCDSVVTLDLTVTTVDVSVTNSSPTLSATVSGASYQWLDCDDNYAVIPGETNQDFTATVNGSYAVAITQNNCTDTSACETVDNVGIQNNNLNLFKVYPNPVKDQLTIELSSSDVNAYRITDATGRLIKEGKLEGLKTTLDVSNFKTQIYFIKVGEEVIKFVKH